MAMEDTRPQPPVRPPGQSEVLPQKLTRSAFSTCREPACDVASLQPLASA